MDDLKKSIKRLMSLKQNDKFLVNSEFQCSIAADNPFSFFVKDVNCPRYISDCTINVKDHSLLAEIQISWNIDLKNSLDCMLNFYDKQELVSMITVSTIEFV